MFHKNVQSNNKKYISKKRHENPDFLDGWIFSVGKCSFRACFWHQGFESGLPLPASSGSFQGHPGGFVQKENQDSRFVAFRLPQTDPLDREGRGNL